MCLSIFCAHILRQKYFNFVHWRFTRMPEKCPKTLNSQESWLFQGSFHSFLLLLTIQSDGIEAEHAVIKCKAVVLKVICFPYEKVAKEKGLVC